MYTLFGLINDKIDALEKYAEYDTIQMIEPISENNMVAEFSDYSSKIVSGCVKYYIQDETKILYFLHIHETDGGQCYSSTHWLYVSEDKSEILDIASDYFNEEHNRENDCKDCLIDNCEKKFRINIEKDNRSDIFGTDSSVEIWDLKL